MTDPEIAELMRQSRSLEDPAERIGLLIKLVEQRRFRSELEVKWWTLGIGLIVAIVGVGGFLLQSNADSRLRAQEVVQRQKEYSVTFYERQLECYLALGELLGRFAKEDAPSPAQIHELDRFIIGRLWYVADWRVIDATVGLMRKLKLDAGMDDALIDGQVMGRIPGESIPPKGELIFEVIRTCRDSLLRAFPDTQIGKLDSLDDFDQQAR